jgi:hypothetical protein
MKVRNEWIEKKSKEEGYRIIYWEMTFVYDGKKLMDGK